MPVALMRRKRVILLFFSDRIPDILCGGGASWLPDIRDLAGGRLFWKGRWAIFREGRLVLFREGRWAVFLEKPAENAKGTAQRAAYE